MKPRLIGFAHPSLGVNAPTRGKNKGKIIPIAETSLSVHLLHQVIYGQAQCLKAL